MHRARLRIGSELLRDDRSVWAGWRGARRRSEAQLPGIKQWPLHNERWRQHFPFITRFHTVTGFAYSYIFFPPPPPFPYFHSKLLVFFFPESRTSASLTLLWMRENKEICARRGTWSIQMPQKYGTMLTSRCTTTVCVFHGLSTRKSGLGSAEKNTARAEKRDRGLKCISVLHIILHRSDINANVTAVAFMLLRVRCCFWSGNEITYFLKA